MSETPRSANNRQEHGVGEQKQNARQERKYDWLVIHGRVLWREFELIQQLTCILKYQCIDQERSNQHSGAIQGSKGAQLVTGLQHHLIWH